MYKRLFSALLLILMCSALAEGREKIFLNNGWSFAQYAGFDLSEAKWSTVSLPHDWVVDLPYIPARTEKMVGWKYAENSAGWYKKVLSIPESDKGMRIVLDLDGVLSRCNVYCNDAEVRPSSDGSFELTNYLVYGRDNELLIRVEAQMKESDTYVGAGLCGDAWLYKSPAVSVSNVRYNTEVFGSRCNVTVYTTVSNSDPEAEEYVSVKQYLEDAIGTSICESQISLDYSIPFSETSYEQTLSFDYPVVWDFGLPYAYSLRTLVIRGGNIVDELRTPLYVRTFTSDDGGIDCSLNGKQITVSACSLEDFYIPVGSAVPAGYWRYLVESKKAAGYNCVRAHNAPSALLDVCDELGFLLIDQVDDVEAAVRRDGNHPCIVMWDVAQSPSFERDKVLARRLDPSRPIHEFSASTALRQPVKEGKVKKSRKKAESIMMSLSKTELKSDGQDIIVADVWLVDDNGNDAPIEKDLYIYVDKDMTTAFGIPEEDARNAQKFAPVCLLGYCNADPAFRETVREWSIPQILLMKAYQGRAQVLIRSIEGCSGPAHIRIGSDSTFGASATINYVD